MNKKQMLTTLYKENGLTTEDVFKHKHYSIITRSGIDKIQAKNKIDVDYEVVNCERDFCVVKATAEHGGRSIQTFGSALHGDFKFGNTNSHYVMEIAEKRAMSRAVLKLAGFYELGAMGEDESEDFKKSKPTPQPTPQPTPSQTNSNIVNQMKSDLDTAKIEGNLEMATNIYEEAEDRNLIQVCDYHDQIFNNKEGM